MLWRREKSLAPVWNQIPIPWPSSPQPGPILNELSWLLRRMNLILVGNKNLHTLHTNKSSLFLPKTTYFLVSGFCGIYIYLTLADST
jgi:hypothetical protein